MNEMTPQEIRAEIRKLEGEVDGKAPRVCVGFNSGSAPPALYGTVYLAWPMGEPVMPTVQADTWLELFSALRAGYAGYAEKHLADTIREMALRIIRVTAERGVCTEADLRMGPFSADQVKTLAERACRDADKIAANGPFSVLHDAAKANAA